MNTGGLNAGVIYDGEGMDLSARFLKEGKQ
jgi:hypothetical protein